MIIKIDLYFELLQSLWAMNEDIFRSNSFIDPLKKYQALTSGHRKFYKSNRNLMTFLIVLYAHEDNDKQLNNLTQPADEGICQITGYQWHFLQPFRLKLNAALKI